MNVIIIPAFFQTKRNPTIGSFFMDQARALQKSGHHVSILYCDTYSVKCLKDFVQYEEENVTETEGITIYRKKYFCPVKHGMDGYRRAFTKGIIELYERYLRDGHVDIIHAHCCVWAGYAAMKLSQKTNIPYVITEHATLFQLHKDDISAKNNEYIKQAFNKASRLICVSRAFSTLLSDYRRDIDVVANVVDCVRFPVSQISHYENKFNFLTVCYMVDEVMLRKKGIDILLKAWKKVVDKLPNARLTIGGGGQGREKAIEWCSEYGIEATVEFVGQLTREQVAEYMQKCDCFVLPSRYETFGVVYIEAMACGKPIIAVKNGGPDDFVKDFNGTLIEPENVDALVDAMICMAQQDKAYKPQQISDFVKANFSEKAIVSQLEKIYYQILEG